MSQQNDAYVAVTIGNASRWELEVGGEAWSWFMSLSPEERAIEVVRAYLNNQLCECEEG